VAHHSLVSLANRMLRLVVQGRYWPYLLLSPPRKAACLLAIAREQQYRLSNSNPRGTTYRHLYISRRKNSYRQSRAFTEGHPTAPHSALEPSELANDHKPKIAPPHTATRTHLHLSPPCRLGSQTKLHKTAQIERSVMKADRFAGQQA
jgi:hypothetical protein